jgi:phospholipid N-methyltransferase
MADISPMRPGRMKRLYTPMISAMGMVQNTVKVPHGLPFRAITTTSASTARTMTQIIRMPMPAIAPGTGPSSERIMSPRERPSRRVDMNRTVMSCTAPANTTPARIHSVPGR